MAAPQARRELELRLKVVADTAGAKAGMDQLAQSADRAQKAMNKAQKEAEAAQKKAEEAQRKQLVAARIARDTASGAIAGVYNPETGKTTYKRGAGSRASDFFFGAPSVDATTGVLGKRGPGGLAAIAGRFGLPTELLGAAGVATAAYQAAKSGKALIDANRDELLTENQRSRKVVGSVIGGETFLSYADTITGRGRDMARAGEEGRVNAVRSQAESQIFTTQLGLQGNVAQTRAQANSLRGARAETTPYIDRTSAEGERRYRVESQLTALRERGATAERSASAAREEGIEAAKSLADIDQRMRANQQRQAQVQRALDRGAGGRASGLLRLAGGAVGSAADVVNAIGDGEPARKRFLDEKAELEAAASSLSANRGTTIQRRGDAANRAAQFDAEAARARGPEKMRADAAEMEEKAGRAMSAAERIGGSTRNDAEQGYLAFQQIKFGGIEFADPRQIAAAERYAPNAIRRLKRESGRNNPLYDAFSQLDDPRDQDFPAERARGDLLRGASDLRNRAGQSDLDISARAAQQGAQMAQATADAFVAAIRANVPNLIEAVKTAILQGRQAAAGSQ